MVFVVLCSCALSEVQEELRAFVVDVVNFCPESIMLGSAASNRAHASLELTEISYEDDCAHVVSNPLPGALLDNEYPEQSD